MLPAAGSAGFADEYARLVDFASLGAFVTNPISARPRAPATGQRVIEFPAGVLIHTGLPNPGVGAAIRQFARKWARMPCPVIVHVVGTTLEETVECIEQLEKVEAVAGVELGLRDDIQLAEAKALVAGVARLGSLPILVRLPLSQAQDLCEPVARAGAQALVVGAPPRGALRAPGGEWVTGRLYGAGTFPLALRAVRAAAGRGLLPVVGSGGVHTPEDARAMLAAGAAAVQVDSATWVEPRTMQTIARSLESVEV